MNRRAWLRGVAALAAATLPGCFGDGSVAGGSSEVDNPIVVAFIDGAGAEISASGSVSVYLSDQNPALDPNPLVQKRVSGLSTVTLSSRDFTQGLPGDASRSYNILILGDDSTGGLVRNLVYNPGQKRYLLDSVKVSRLSVKVAPLVRYQASLDVASDTGLLRVIVPGTPFQSVVVDSSFTFEGVPQGDLPLHLLPGDGSERPLNPKAGDPQDPPRHQIDTTKPPIVHPPGPPPAEALKIRAGEDRTLVASPDGSAPFTLNAEVRGVTSQDPRLAVVWRKVLPGPQGAKAVIQNPSALRSPVTLPRAGVYQFIVRAAFESQTSEDTIYVGVQAPQQKPAFIQPALDDVVHWNHPFELSWEDDRGRALRVEVTLDTGKTWALIETVPSKPGMNRRNWVPSGDGALRVTLRLTDSVGTVRAMSPTFWLAPKPAGGSGVNHGGDGDKAGGAGFEQNAREGLSRGAPESKGSARGTPARERRAQNFLRDHGPAQGLDAP